MAPPSTAKPATVDQMDIAGQPSATQAAPQGVRPIVHFPEVNDVARARHHALDLKFHSERTVEADFTRHTTRINPYNSQARIRSLAPEKWTYATRETTAVLRVEDNSPSMVLEFPPSVFMSNAILDPRGSVGLRFTGWSSEPIKVSVGLTALTRGYQPRPNPCSFVPLEQPFETVGAATTVEPNANREISLEWPSPEALSDYNFVKVFLKIERGSTSEKALDVGFDGPMFVQYGQPTDGVPEIALLNWAFQNMKQGIPTMPTGLTPPKFIEDVDESVLDAVFSKALKNLFNLENQRWASALPGSDIDRMVENLGLQTLKFESLVKGEFDFFQHIIEGKVPLESGDFGEYHTPDSHGRQVVAMTRDMSHEEKVAFAALYKEIGFNPTFGWRVWNLLFDGADPSLPTAPQYWLRHLNRRLHAENRAKGKT